MDIKDSQLGIYSSGATLEIHLGDTKKIRVKEPPIAKLGDLEDSWNLVFTYWGHLTPDEFFDQMGTNPDLRNDVFTLLKDFGIDTPALLSRSQIFALCVCSNYFHKPKPALLEKGYLSLFCQIDPKFEGSVSFLQTADPETESVYQHAPQLTNLEKSYLYAFNLFGGLDHLNQITANQLAKLAASYAFSKAVATSEGRHRILENKWKEEAKTKPLDLEDLTQRLKKVMF